MKKELKFMALTKSPDNKELVIEGTFIGRRPWNDK
jgi:hypothetical protein